MFAGSDEAVAQAVAKAREEMKSAQRHEMKRVVAEAIARTEERWSERLAQELGAAERQLHQLKKEGFVAITLALAQDDASTAALAGSLHDAEASVQSLEALIKEQESLLNAERSAGAELAQALVRGDEQLAEASKAYADAQQAKEVQAEVVRLALEEAQRQWNDCQERETEALLEQVGADHSAALKKAREESAAATRASLEKQHQQALSDAWDRAVESSSAEAAARSAAALRSEKEAHAAELASVRAELASVRESAAAELAAVRKAAAAELRTAAEAAEASRQKLQAEAAAAAAAAAAELSRVDGLRVAAAEDLIKARDKMGSTVAEAKRAAQDELDRAAAEMQQLRAELRRERERTREELSSTEEARVAEVQRLDEARAKLQAQHVELRRRHAAAEEEAAQLRTDLEAAEAASGAKLESRLQAARKETARALARQRESLIDAGQVTDEMVAQAVSLVRECLGAPAGSAASKRKGGKGGKGVETKVPVDSL